MNQPNNYRIDGISTRELIDSNNIDISEYFQIHFYELFWYCNPTSGVYKEDKIGRIYGIENYVGKVIFFNIITKKISNPLDIFQELSRYSISST